MRAAAFVTWSVLFVTVGGCGGRLPNRCMKRVDCAAGQVCSGGVCQTLMVDAGRPGAGGGDEEPVGGGFGGGDALGLCSSQTCPNGCCDLNDVCQAGTTRGACGFGGSLCASCGSQRVCVAGFCEFPPSGGGSAGGAAGGVAVSPCSATNCPFGCCDAIGRCLPGDSAQACGSKGAQCLSCLGTDLCRAGGCVLNSGGGSAGGGPLGGGSAGGTSGGGVTGGGSPGGGVAGGAAGGSAGGGGPAVGESCETAQALMPGTLAMPQSVVASTVGYARNHSMAGNGCANAQGRDRVFSLSVMPGERLLASIRSQDGVFDPLLNVILGPAAQCSATPVVCAAGDDFGLTSSVNSVRYLNAQNVGQSVLLVASTYVQNDSGGPFRLDVSVDVPPMGDTCENPTPLQVGTPKQGEVLSGFVNDYQARTGNQSTCLSTGNLIDGIDRAYRLTVAAGETISVTVTPSAALNVSLNLHATEAECLSRNCLTWVNSQGPGGAETLTYRNLDATARTVLLVVETPAGSIGTYAISASTMSFPGDVCTTAVTGTTGLLSNQTLAGYTVDYAQSISANGCVASQGPDRVFTFQVPARTRLAVTSTPSGGMDTTLNVVAGPAAQCQVTPRVCVSAASSQGPNTPETALWDNGSLSPQTAHVIVGARTPATAIGTFALSASLATGESCRSPTIVSGPFPATLSNESINGMRRDINVTGAVNCVPSASAEHVYEVQVDPGKVLSVTATPSGSEDLVLNLFSSESNCMAMVPNCLRSANAQGGGMPETVSGSNATASPLPAFIAVSRLSDGPMAYSITFRVQ